MKVKEPSEASLLTDAVWRGNAPAATKPQLRARSRWPAATTSKGRLARAYPEQLSHVVAEVRIARGLFARNLAQVTGRLGEADIPAVLIKGDLPDDCVRNDFDLVVEERHWDGTFTALAGWYVHSSTYWLERTTKALLFPPVGPGAAPAHRHLLVRRARWCRPTELLGRASGNGHGCLSPAPVDELRIWLAHAMFQNLALDLSELFAVRDLLRPELIEARPRGKPPGKAGGRGYDAGGRGRPRRPSTGSTAGPRSGCRPASAAAVPAGGRGARLPHAPARTALAASRAAALRVALVAAKQRRRRLTR